MFKVGRITVKLRRKSQLTIHYIFNRFAVIFRFKGSMPSNEFINRNSCRPNIYFFCIPTPCKHLRGSIIKSTSYGKHFDLFTSSSMLSADAIVNKLQFFVYFIIEDIFRFDISMTHSPQVQIMQSLKQLLNDLSELIFRADLQSCQTWCLKQLHNQPASMLFEIQIKCFVFNYIAMCQTFYQDKVAPYLRNVFVIKHKTFYCVMDSAAFFTASMYYTVCTLSQFRYYVISLAEYLSMLV